MSRNKEKMTKRKNAVDMLHGSDCRQRSDLGNEMTDLFYCTKFKTSLKTKSLNPINGKI